MPELLQNGKHDEVMLARSVERLFEKLDSQLDAAAPVKVVVVPSLTSTTVADDCERAAVASEAIMSSVEIFMVVEVENVLGFAGCVRKAM